MKVFFITCSLQMVLLICLNQTFCSPEGSHIKAVIFNPTLHITYAIFEWRPIITTISDGFFNLPFHPQHFIFVAKHPFLLHFTNCFQNARFSLLSIAYSYTILLFFLFFCLYEILISKKLNLTKLRRMNFNVQFGYFDTFPSLLWCMTLRFSWLDLINTLMGVTEAIWLFIFFVSSP